MRYDGENDREVALAMFGGKHGRTDKPYGRPQPFRCLEKFFTVEAIKETAKLAKYPREKERKRKGFCALLPTNIYKAFNFLG